MLYPRTLSLPSGGRTFTAVPNAAVNIAMTAGLFSLRPAMRIYTPYDQTSGRAVKRLTALLVVGGIIKAAHWHYKDVVILSDSGIKEEPSPKPNTPYTGNFVVVGRGSSVSFGAGGYRYGNGNGVDSIIDNDLDTLNNDSIQFVSPQVGLDLFEMGMPVGVPEHSRQGVIKINFASIIARGWCTEGDSIDGSSTLSQGPLVTFNGQPISLKFAEAAGCRQCMAERTGVVVDNVNSNLTSLAIANKALLVSFSVYCNIKILVVIAFLATFTGLGLIYMRRRVAVVADIAVPLIKRRMQGKKILKSPELSHAVTMLYLDEDPIIVHSGNRIFNGEVWFSKETMDIVNTFIANDCQFLHSTEEAQPFRPIARPGFEVVLYAMETFAAATMWFFYKLFGEEECIKAAENALSKYDLPEHSMRYLRYLIFPKPVVDVPKQQRRIKTRRRRGRHRLDRGLNENGDRENGRFLPKVAMSVVCIWALICYFQEDYDPGAEF